MLVVEKGSNKDWRERESKHKEPTELKAQHSSDRALEEQDYINQSSNVAPLPPKNGSYLRQGMPCGLHSSFRERRTMGISPTIEC